MTSPYDMSDETPVYVISVAAQLSGLHPQTLRAYDRLGLVSPGRSTGRGRRYSMRDVLALREVQRLSQDEGVNLSGIKRILELNDELDRSRRLIADLHSEVAQLRVELESTRSRGRAAGRPAQEGPGRPRDRPGPQRAGRRLGTGHGPDPDVRRPPDGTGPRAARAAARRGRRRREARGRELNRPEGTHERENENRAKSLQWTTNLRGRARTRCRPPSGEPPRTATPRSTRCTCWSR